MKKGKKHSSNVITPLAILKAEQMLLSLNKTEVVIELDGFKYQTDLDTLTPLETALLRLQFEKRIEFVGQNTSLLFKEEKK
jgi:hypothetical protein